MCQRLRGIETDGPGRAGRAVQLDTSVHFGIDAIGNNNNNNNGNSDDDDGIHRGNAASAHALLPPALPVLLLLRPRWVGPRHGHRAGARVRCHRQSRAGGRGLRRHAGERDASAHSGQNVYFYFCHYY